MENSKSRSTTD